MSQFKGSGSFFLFTWRSFLLFNLGLQLIGFGPPISRRVWWLILSVNLSGYEMPRYLGVSVRVFSEEIWIGALRSRLPPQCGWESFNLLRAQIEQKDGWRLNSLSLSLSHFLCLIAELGHQSSPVLKLGLRSWDSPAFLSLLASLLLFLFSWRTLADTEDNLLYIVCWFRCYVYPKCMLNNVWPSIWTPCGPVRMTHHTGWKSWREAQMRLERETEPCKSSWGVQS